MFLSNEITNCRACPAYEFYKRPVPFAGNPEAQIMILGRDPGADEVEQGIPFVGKAGQELNEVLQMANINRDDCCIVNTVCCRPLQNVPYGPSTYEFCGNRFAIRAMKMVMPKIVVSLGKEATQFILGINITMGSTRGHIHPIERLKKEGIVTVSTWHPSYIARLKNMDNYVYQEKKMEMVNDFILASKYCISN